MERPKARRLKAPYLAQDTHRYTGYRASWERLSRERESLPVTRFTLQSPSGLQGLSMRGAFVIRVPKSRLQRKVPEGVNARDLLAS